MPHVSTRQAFPWLQNARLPHLAFLFLLAAIVLPRESFASERFEPRPPENLEQCIQWLGSIEPEPHDCREIDNVAICVWPTQLSLDVRESGAAFTLEVSVFAPVDVVLPGSEDAWPQDVKLDRKSPALLRADEGVPTVTLTQGQHTLTGFIPWSEIPDNLAIPGATGLLRLRINGKTIPFPARIEGELSLVTDLEQDEEEEDLAVDALAPDSEKLEVSRALLDGVPMRVKTRVLLHITGKEREWVLPNPLLVGTKLIEVNSSVPVTFRDDGSLVMSVRPGTLRIDLEGYLPSSPTSLVAPKHPAPWPTQEVWIWRAATGGAPSIGQVSLSGAPAVELSRTHAPSEWAGGATYLVGRNDALNFEVLQRGVSQSGSNHLTLHRNMRADYAGTGWTVVDQINGEMHLAKRLDLTADNGELGSVVLGEKAQVVTIGSEEHHGVDLHSHNLSMRATWRIQEATSTLPLGAWSEEFDGVNLDFMLPQGWDLLHAQGPGNVAPTWIGTWTSLAFLGLLAVVVLVVRVVGPLAGAAALLGFGLSYTSEGGFGYLLVLVAGGVLLILPLRRALSGNVVYLVRGLWCFVALELAAWAVLRVPTRVVDVWRTGISGLGHRHLETEIVGLFAAGSAIGVAVLVVVGLAAFAARSFTSSRRYLVVLFTAPIAMVLVFATLSDRSGSGPSFKSADGGSDSKFARYQLSTDEEGIEEEPVEEEEPMAAEERAGGHFLEAPPHDENVWGALTGTEIGEANGVGGLGMVGTGSGGGGAGEGTIGLDSTGLIGRGAGGGNGAGYGRGSGTRFGGRGARAAHVRQGKAEVKGGMDGEIVRRIVRAHSRELSACYNNGLARNPNLEGRVVVQFMITASGSVATSVVQSTTLKDKSVANCVASAINGWKFPKPKAGEAAIVTYSFNMTQGGEGSNAPSRTSREKAVKHDDGQREEERFVATDVELPEADAPAIAQTDEGVPDWQGPRWQLKLERAVKKDETMKLWLVTPTVSRALAVSRIVAIFFFLFALMRAGWRTWANRSVTPRAAKRTAVKAGTVLSSIAVLCLATPAAANIPYGDEEEYECDGVMETINECTHRTRPLVPATQCGEDCALLTRLEVDVSGNTLALRAQVHMQAPGVWRVPGTISTWLPTSVRLDGKPAQALAAYDDMLYVHMATGIHVVQIEGPISQGMLDLALGTNAMHVVSRAKGWQVEGIDEHEVAESLHLQRDGFVDPEAEAAQREEAESLGAAKSSQDMAPWYAVRRELKIGPRWTVETTVLRLHGGPSPSKVHIALLPGEKMLEASGRVEEPRPTLTFARAVESIKWTSVLDETTDLELVAPTDQPWMETWSISCEGAWQCQDEGLPASSDDGATRVFHPWPGEKLQVFFFEPRAAPGQHITVDSAALDLLRSQAGTEAKLVMSVRSTTVSERTLTLPDDAYLGEVKLDGTDVPVAKHATEIRATFQPGVHQLRVTFKTDAGASHIYHAPSVHLGGEAVNARVTIRDAQADDRVVLWTSGQGAGPFVWLWGFFAVLAGAAWLLARHGRTNIPSWKWFLFGLGFSAQTIALLWLWLLVMAAYRRRDVDSDSALVYNATKMSLALSTLAVFGLMLATGMQVLSWPESTMLDQMSPGDVTLGNGLSWYVDRAATTTPAASVVTISSSLWSALWACWVAWLGWTSVGLGRSAWQTLANGGWLREKTYAEVEEQQAEIEEQQLEAPMPS